MRQCWVTTFVGNNTPTETVLGHYIIRHKFHGFLKIYLTLQEIKWIYAKSKRKGTKNLYQSSTISHFLDVLQEIQFTATWNDPWQLSKHEMRREKNNLILCHNLVTPEIGRGHLSAATVTYLLPHD